MLGRFIGRDTFAGVASAPQTGNRYNYALSNPFRYTDPSGHFVEYYKQHPGELASLIVSFTPPGLAYGAFYALTGHDPIAGRDLDPLERVLNFLPVLDKLGHFLTSAEHAGDAFRAVGRSADNVFETVGESLGKSGADDVGRVTSNLGEAGDVGRGGSGAGAVGTTAERSVDPPGSTIAEQTGRVETFSSFEKAKAKLGTNVDEDIHHIVEQSQAKATRSGFDVRRINSTDNMVRLPREVHQRIGRYYSTKNRELDMTVRSWMNGQTWDMQYEFGREIVRRALAGSL